DEMCGDAARARRYSTGASSPKSPKLTALLCRWEEERDSRERFPSCRTTAGEIRNPPPRSRSGAPPQGGPFMAVQLRVYPSSVDPSEMETPEPSVRVRLGDLLPLIALAHRQNYVWLRDFLDDEVGITADLYEVLRAFRCYRPPA